jgi:hypothetical protein
MGKRKKKLEYHSRQTTDDGQYNEEMSARDNSQLATDNRIFIFAS